MYPLSYCPDHIPTLTSPPGNNPYLIRPPPGLWADHPGDTGERDPSVDSERSVPRLPYALSYPCILSRIVPIASRPSHHLPGTSVSGPLPVSGRITPVIRGREIRQSTPRGLFSDSKFKLCLERDEWLSTVNRHVLMVSKDLIYQTLLRLTQTLL